VANVGLRILAAVGLVLWLAAPALANAPCEGCQGNHGGNGQDPDWQGGQGSGDGQGNGNGSGQGNGTGGGQGNGNANGHRDGEGNSTSQPWQVHVSGCAWVEIDPRAAGLLQVVEVDPDSCLREGIRRALDNIRTT
jgi:hypothetical protein